MNLKCFVFILSICTTTILYSQEQYETQIIEQRGQLINEQEWTSSLLSATSNALYSAVLFNGRVFTWSMRGGDYPATYINGVELRSPLRKLRVFDIYSGLQNAFHKDEVVVNGEFSQNGYQKTSTISFVTTEVPIGKKKLIVNNRMSNNFNTNSLSLNYYNGGGEYDFRQSTGILMQQSQKGTVPVGYQQSLGLTYCIEKQFNKSNRLSLSLIWNLGDQGKVATSVKETYELSAGRIYNPNWGWKQQNAYYPSTRQSNAPLILLKFHKTWHEQTFLKLGNMLVIGSQSESSLEWSNTADPRPDYYKYLPSYFSDSALQNSLTSWYRQHPEQLQIQFDKIEKINKSSRDGRSYYIINQEDRDLLLMHGSLLFSHTIKSHFNIQLGAQYLTDQIIYTNRIKDLLGGMYYYNYNGWINEDGTTSSFQNDLIKPDRKIKQGERWGAGFAMHAIEVNPWIQLRYEKPKIETGFGIGYGIQGLRRTGYYANGLYPETSFGKSEFVFSPSWDFKAQFLYKISGRIYLRSIVFSQWLAKDVEGTFINPDVNSIASPFSANQFHKGADLCMFYRSPTIKITASVYWKDALNESIQKMFYHDAYAAFVYGIAGNVKKEYFGVESTLETSIFQNIQLGIVSTIQKNIFKNDPSYLLLSVNDLQLMESGRLHLNALPASNSPSFTNALSLSYQPTYATRVGITILYAQQRPVSIDVFRRSDYVKNKLDAYSWNSLSTHSFLSDQCVVNAFLSKSFQIKTISRQYRCTVSFSARNMFNVSVPVIAYEQSRFDYIHFNSNKYALKYLMDQGVTYSLRFQLQIQ